MGRKKADIHYIYKTTCNVTGKWYVGMHSTANIEDGYMGSGKKLRYSIRKYGVDNHTKEILEYCYSRDELIVRENEIVTKELISDSLCMNLKEGGQGGFCNEEHVKKCSEAGNKAKKFKLDNDVEYKKNHVNNFKKSFEKAYLEGKINPPSFKGKKHSDETKQLMSEKAKLRTCELNSQYGTCWITKDGENKKIKKEKITNWLDEGWVKGRKI